MAEELNEYELGLRQLIEVCRRKGISVEFVGDELLHDYIGMNSEAARAMGFPMPDNTIYVDKNLRDQTKYETLRHEVIEMDLMREGKNYWPSHLVALKRERELPRKLLKMRKRERVTAPSLVGVRL